MKWFEHQTSDRKELASKLIKRKFGLAGYGIFQSLLEIIGENMENDNVQEWGFVKSGLKMKDLAQEIGCSEAEFRAFVTFCDDQLILELKNNRLFCPFVLERMNEYASRVSAKAKRKDNPVKTENTEIPYSTESSASQHSTVTNTTQSQHKELNNSEMPSAVKENPLGITPKVIPKPSKGGATHKWQDSATRMADSLGFKPTPSWFKLFKECDGTPQEGILLSTYSAIADMEGVQDMERYFFGVFNKKLKGDV